MCYVLTQMGTKGPIVETLHVLKGLFRVYFRPSGCNGISFRSNVCNFFFNAPAV